MLRRVRSDRNGEGVEGVDEKVSRENDDTAEQQRSATFQYVSTSLVTRSQLLSSGIDEFAPQWSCKVHSKVARYTDKVGLR